MSKEYVRSLLSEKDVILFDQIECHQLLGATNHIHVIGGMIEHLAANSADSLVDRKKKIVAVTDYFINTRGKASQAITNAIHLMTQNIQDKQSGMELIAQKNAYFAESEENRKKIVSYGVNLSQKYRTLLCYDYSSTVKDMLIELEKDGQQRTLIIPESRAINGGKPYAGELSGLNYNVKFIPDCAIYYYAKDCDACYMGAETFYADGTGFNTIGADLVALVCQYWHVPLYFITPMIKLDARALFGYEKPLVINDLTKVLTEQWTNEQAVKELDCYVPELIGVERQFISGFITEYGIILPEQMYSVAQKYLEKVYGGDLDNE